MSSKLIVDTLEDNSTTYSLALGSGNSSLPGTLDLSSGGVYLGGSGSANLLDDYEEGTWTPVLTGITPTTATGTYVKIGKICYIGIFLNLGSQSSTGSSQVSNFPFTVANDNDARAGLTLSYSTYTTPLTFLLNDNTDFGYLRSYGGSIQTWNTLSTRVFHIGGVYQTA